MTIHKQTAKLLARIAENLPSDIDNTTMQGWIDNPNGLQKFLRGLCSPKWREEGGLIRFSVTSDGASGYEWIYRLEKKGIRVSAEAGELLRSSKFMPTKGVKTEIALVRGSSFHDGERVTHLIQSKARERELEPPNAEVVCLILERFTHEEIEEMGIRHCAVMHQPIEDSKGSRYLLKLCSNANSHWLHICDGSIGVRWGHDFGFAFALPEVSPDRPHFAHA